MFATSHPARKKFHVCRSAADAETRRLRYGRNEKALARRRQIPLRSYSMNAAVPLKKIPVLKLVLVIRNKSVQDLANHLGLYREQVSPWVNGRDEPDREHAQKIADWLKWDLDEIWDDETPTVTKKRPYKKRVGKAKLVSEDALRSSSMLDAQAERHLHAVPAIEVDPRLDVLLSVGADKLRPYSVDVFASIAAGGLDDRTASREPDPIYVAPEHRKYKAVRVDGDSMIGAGIEHRDILLVRTAKTAKDGDIVVALVDNEGTIKRYRNAGGDEVLVPENPKYSKIPLRDPSRVQGVAVAIYKPPRT